MRTSRLAWLLFCSALLAALIPAGTAEAVKLRVRGGSSIKLVAIDQGDEVLLRGQLTDDVGASLGKVSVRIEAVDDAGRTVRMDTPSLCGSPETSGSVRMEAGAYVVTAIERGTFCVRKPGPAGGYRFRAKFVGNNFFEGTEVSVHPIAENEERAQTSLKFDAPPATIDLDRGSIQVSVTLRVDKNDAARLLATATKREGLTIVLADERGEKLAEGTTGGDGRARFELKTADLAEPGAGEIRATFEGDKQLAPSQSTVQVTRTAGVRLDAAERVTGDPESGVTIEVDVATSRGAVDGGVIEATLNESSVGSANVKDGKASVVVSFVGGAATSVPVQLRYLPGPHFLDASKPVTVEVRVQGPSPIRQGILAVVGLFLAGWIVRQWRRAPKAERHDSGLPPPPSGRPEILVLERPSGLRGWRGVVTDAHDATPISGAELRIVVPTFDGRGVLASARADEDGNFSLDVDAPKDARLIVEGEFHATYEQPLPSPSVLRVALVTRRRALLDRLVRWARTKGTPFDSSKEPTPGHVRRAAARAGANHVELWAGKLERAAFGPDAVTRHVEEEIASTEPQGSPLPKN